jgi:hypothetical protein
MPLLPHRKYSLNAMYVCTVIGRAGTINRHHHFMNILTTEHYQYSIKRNHEDGSSSHFGALIVISVAIYHFGGHFSFRRSLKNSFLNI